MQAPRAAVIPGEVDRVKTKTTRPVLRIAMSVIRSTWLLSAVFGFGLIASGCGGGSPNAANLVKDPIVRPKSLGPPGKCYYLVTPVECTNQGAQGTPTPMPPLWLATYWPYYASSSYYSQIPVQDEVAYAQDIGNFASQNNQAIVNDASDGEWVDQDGNTWEGNLGDDPDSVANADASDDDSGDDSDDDSDDDGGDDGGDDDDDGGDDDGGDDD